MNFFGGKSNSDDDQQQACLIAADAAISDDLIAHEACALASPPSQQQRQTFSSFLDELDSEKIIVTLVLFVVITLLLEPRGSLRGPARRWWKRWLSKRRRKGASNPQEEGEQHNNDKNEIDNDELLDNISGQLTPDINNRNNAADAVFRHASSDGVVSGSSTGSVPPTIRGVSSAPTSPCETNAKAPAAIPATTSKLSLAQLSLFSVENFPSFNTGGNETEAEIFTQLWPAIKESPYRRLVLPPQCKRVERPLNNKEASEENTKAKKQKQQHDEDDHPLHRLQSYWRQVWYFLRSILSYDYAAAVWWLIHWLRELIRLRRGQGRADDEQQEEEDDEVSLATHASSLATTTRAGTVVTSTGGTVTSVRAGAVSPIRSPTGTTVSHFNNSLQDSNMELTPNSPRPGDHDDVSALNESGLSYQSMPDDGASASDGSELTPAEPPPQIPPLHSRFGRRKDALQSYRDSTASTMKPTLAPKAASEPQLSLSLPHPAPATPVPYDEADSPPPIAEDTELPERNRSDSSEMLSFFDAAHSKASLKRLSLANPVPDKNGYIVGDEYLQSSNTPLLVFVNSRSGPQQGQLLITQLRRLLNPIQVWDLADGGPEEVLESFWVMRRLRILVCGGDGTVSWIISALEKMAMERWPPIAILPLGTGNDLARIHGWGGGYNNESLITILEQVSDAYISLLDRWEMTVENKKGKVKEVKSFINYLGVGVDAQAALQVHMLRESSPTLFFSRAVNKAWYAIFGAEDAIKASHANLPQEITLIADGVEVPLPPDSQGIILLNIDSYAGGIPMWSQGARAGGPSVAARKSSADGRGEFQLRRSLSLDSLHNSSLSQSLTMERGDSVGDLPGLERSDSDEEKRARVTSCDSPSSCQDGLLDIISIRGTFHLGQIRVGLSNAQKLCQCKEATIIIRRKTAVQIDGEPWRQTVSTLRIKHKKEQAVMLHRSADESGGAETEFANLLDWALDRAIIDRDIHVALMREFSRRIENKARQRRVKNQDNWALSLKRAMVGSVSHPVLSNGNPYV